MTKFEHAPPQKVVIQQLIKVDFEEFRKRRIVEGSVAKWCNGILFAPFPAPDSIDTVRDELAGKLHWFYCEVTECAEKIILLKNDGIELPVMDVSNNPMFADFTDWLKVQEIWSDSK